MNASAIVPQAQDTAGFFGEPFQGPFAFEAIDICKSFGALQVLDHISFKLSRGSFHALLGGNGAGKSTLVKCIMGYYHADQGAVLIDNRECEITNTRDAHLHGLGMV